MAHKVCRYYCVSVFFLVHCFFDKRDHFDAIDVANKPGGV